MNLITKPALIICALLALSACERSDYTTWQCESTDSPLKTKFILDKSKLIINDEEFKYCGSLGKTSYFDIDCMKDTGKQTLQFIPESGQLNVGIQTFKCKVI